MIFKSDNMIGVSEEILNAITLASYGFQSSYGSDEFSKKMQERFSKIFEKDVKVFLTSTGTAANSLALLSLTRSHESILCYKNSHIKTDECNAPVFFSGGSNLILIDGENGKINFESLKERFNFAKSLGPRLNKPACLSLTQGTESGTIYSLEELNQICYFAKTNNLSVHMDGARFTNAIVSLNCSPAEMTWKAGVDVLSFGATKNGALCAEAVIFFNHDIAKDFEYILKQSGQTFSKTRFFSVQFLAYFENDLWLRNASHANLMAKKLEIVFRKFNIDVYYQVEINQVFVLLDDDLKNFLMRNNFEFYQWDSLNFSNMYRFVTSCFTKEDEIEKFEKSLMIFFEKT